MNDPYPGVLDDCLVQYRAAASHARRQIAEYIAARFGGELLDRSISALKTARPEFSAERTFTRTQGAILLAIPAIVAILFFIAPAIVGAIVAGLCALGFIANAVFRALLVWVGAGDLPRVTAPPPRDLPLYTILVPLYREGNILPALVAAMRALDYPREKLDIKLVLEADDGETIAAAKALALEECFEVISVPRAEPRTKPKACSMLAQTPEEIAESRHTFRAWKTSAISMRWPPFGTVAQR